MSGWAKLNVTLERTRWNYDELPVQLNGWQRRSAGQAETFHVSCSLQLKNLDTLGSRNPTNLGAGGEQVRRMSRPGVFSTALAMTKEETFEYTDDLELDGTAKARAMLSIDVHDLVSTSR